MDGLFGDGLVDVLCCGGDSLEEDLRWGPGLGALVDLVEFVDGVTSCGVALFKTVEETVKDCAIRFVFGIFVSARRTSLLRMRT